MGETRQPNVEKHLAKYAGTCKIKKKQRLQSSENSHHAVFFFPQKFKTILFSKPEIQTFNC